MSLFSSEQPHTCHHPLCRVVVPEKMLACTKHWVALPPAVRSDIWRAYRPGQEIDKAPGANWWAAYAAAVEAWGFPEEAKRYRALIIRADKRDAALRAIVADNHADGAEPPKRVTKDELVRMIRNYGVEMETAGSLDATGGNPDPKWKRAHQILEDITAALDAHYEWFGVSQ